MFDPDTLAVTPRCGDACTVTLSCLLTTSSVVLSSEARAVRLYVSGVASMSSVKSISSLAGVRDPFCNDGAGKLHNPHPSLLLPSCRSNGWVRVWLKPSSVSLDLYRNLS